MAAGSVVFDGSPAELSNEVLDRIYGRQTFAMAA